MAFSYTVAKRTHMGPYRCAWGTFTITGATTGGDVVTGFDNVLFFWIQEATGTVHQNRAVINENLPLGSGSVTVVCDNVVGTNTWFAVGK
jgi:hypothetical protein